MSNGGTMMANDYSFGGCDKTALKNYAAMSAMYWPGLDSSSYAAAYSQANASALAAVANNFAGNGAMQSGSGSSIGTASVGSASPPESQQTSEQNMYNQERHPSQVQTQLPSTNSHPATMISTPNSQVTSLMAALAPSNMSSMGMVHSTTPTTPPKKKAKSVPVHMKDETYWDRRRRNNDSARRSRESRRMKEEQIAMRVVYLEQENLQLRTEVQMLRQELDKVRLVLYSTSNHQQSMQTMGMPQHA